MYKITRILSSLTFLLLGGSIFFAGAGDDKIEKVKDIKQEQTLACPLCDDGFVLLVNHIKLYGEALRQTNVLFETDNFYVVIDNYPVCDDHILIVPRLHVFSYSVVDLEFEYELEAVVKTLCEITGTNNYGLFEHGSNLVGAQQKACGNSVFHAHMHFIPSLNMKKQEIIKLCKDGKKEQVIEMQKGFSLEDCFANKIKEQTILRYIKTLPTSTPYLFCYYSSFDAASLCVPDYLLKNGAPSQFFRRVFAEYFQKTIASDLFWNWKDQTALKKSEIFRKRVVKKTVEKFRDKKKVKNVFDKYFTAFQKVIHKTNVNEN